MSHFNLANAAYRASYEYLYHEHHQRKRAIYKQITANDMRFFAAVAMPYTSGKGLDDVNIFTTHSVLGPGTTSVYYCDGAYRIEHGLLASAVAYQDGMVWQTEAASLPRYCGKHSDAELYAIKMAFDVAIRHVFDQGRSINNIVIFSDSQDTIQMLAGESDTRRPMGPIPTTGTWALEDVYDAAEKLAASGIIVVIAWIKGHRGGAGREGNRRADAAAKVVIDLELHLQSQNFGAAPPQYELPAWVEGLDGDVKDEALWRLSEPFFRWGSGSCWITPSLQPSNDVPGENEEEEEDWTVYRPVTTLKEAQEEDARLLREHFAEEALQRKMLPCRDPMHFGVIEKAAPLKHIWSKTRSFKKKPKVLDFRAAYRKALEMARKVE